MLSRKQNEYLNSQGYYDPVLVDYEFDFRLGGAQIWAFHESDKTAMMPTHIPHAIAQIAYELSDVRSQSKAESSALTEFERIWKRNEAWYQRNAQVQLWLNALPFLRGVHCAGCGIIHKRHSSPNYCDRCEEFLRKREADWEIPF